MTQSISIPRNLTPQALLPFSLVLRNAPLAQKYILDFTKLSLVEPFGMLFLAAIIRQFVRERREAQGKQIEINVINFEDKTYASFMGLFKSFGVDHGNRPGEACGSGTYIPLTRLAVSRIERDARDSYSRLQDVIETESGKIASVLTRADEGPIKSALRYSICELMRNVVEHGNARHIWYAAQYWPSKNRVEVAVLDEGIGLLPSLKRNRKLTVQDNRDAIRLALLPGISGIERPDRRIDGDWTNTGYGLYMTSAMCERAGNFILCNYSDAIEVAEGKAEWHSCAFSGVAIRMVIDTSRIQNANKMLSEIRHAANVKS